MRASNLINYYQKLEDLADNMIFEIAHNHLNLLEKRLKQIVSH